jgi:hypothetical protein
MRKYEETGQIQPKRRGGAMNIKVTTERRGKIGKWIEECPDLTLSQLSTKFSDLYGIAITNQTVSKILTGLNYTFKLLREVPVSRNSLEQVERRFAYAVHYNNNTPNDALKLIWVDETGIICTFEKSSVVRKRGTVQAFKFQHRRARTF